MAEDVSMPETQINSTPIISTWKWVVAAICVAACLGLLLLISEL
jgi:hypothetical protein